MLQKPAALLSNRESERDEKAAATIAEEYE